MYKRVDKCKYIMLSKSEKIYMTKTDRYELRGQF